MADSKNIEVTSHVARDFLQNSAYFNTMSKIVWEYVSNSLDAAKENSQVAVIVEISSNEVSISDDGMGMSREELGNFFRMHGENHHRKRGKRVRGRFGTGKSAAFGLANYLMIETVQSGLKNAVELQRKDIEDATDGAPFPVRDIIVNEPTDESDGTRVVIRDFNIKRQNIDKIIAYIEHHLSRYRQRAFVRINGHECKFKETPALKQYRLQPPPDVADRLGNVDLTIKVSAIPLDDDTKGIDVLSHGIWHETTLAGIDNKERANYLFGEIDVPLLEDGDWKIPPFDNTRNNILNRQNPLVVVLLGWLAEELEKVRVSIVAEERERRKSEESKQLAQEAERIAEILNQDFEQVEMEFDIARKVAKRSGRAKVGELVDERGELLPGDGTEPTNWQSTGHAPKGGSRGKLAGAGDTARPGPTLQPGNDLGTRKELNDEATKRRKAIFTLDYEHATPEADRSRFDRETKTIFINLDHTQIATAYEAGSRKVSDQHFRQICYEVAAVEYALAIPFEKIERDEINDPADALFDVKETINRVIRRLV